MYEYQLLLKAHIFLIIQNVSHKKISNLRQWKKRNEYD